MDQRRYDKYGNNATHTNQYQVRREDGYNAPAISEMNNINASSSEFDIAQSLQRGGSSDQPAAGNGRRNEEQQHNSHGAGDHSFDKAKDDDDKEPDTWLKNGIYIVCSFFATFCLEAILNLPGGIEPMKMTADQLQNFQLFLNYDVSCFLLSVTAIFLVTLSSCFPSKYSLHINSLIIGALIVSVTLLFQKVLVLATNDHLAHVAFMQGLRSFVIIMLALIVAGLLTSKEFRSFIRKECRKIRGSIA